MKLAVYRRTAQARSRNAPPDSLPVESLGASWARFGDDVLLFCEQEAWSGVAERAGRAGMEIEPHSGDVARDRLHLVVQKGRLFQQEHPDVPVVYDCGRYLVVELAPDVAARLARRDDVCFGVHPLEADQAVFEVTAPRGARRAPEPWVSALVDGVARETYESDLGHLVSYPTRHSTSAHFVEAAEWARSELEALGYDAHLETIDVAGAASHNVVAEKTGKGPEPRGVVLVVAHLDSVNQRQGPAAAAPGADDNASGSAGLLQIARALSGHTPVHDLRMALFGGEEQNLYGSRQYLAALDPAERRRLRAVLNMDMIGSRNTPDPAVLLEGAPLSREMIDALVEAAAEHTGLETQTSLRPYASDHVPFIEAGIPAVLTIEGADGANSAIHTADDTLDRIDIDLAVEILRMNVAFVAGAVGRTQ